MIVYKRARARKMAVVARASMMNRASATPVVASAEWLSKTGKDANSSRA
jgi:hypothetical protein